VQSRCDRRAPSRGRLEASGVRGSETVAAAIYPHTIRERCSGLGRRTSLDWLEIKWPLPSGRTERFSVFPVDRYVTVVEGKGRAEMTRGSGLGARGSRQRRPTKAGRYWITVVAFTPSPAARPVRAPSPEPRLPPSRTGRVDARHFRRGAAGAKRSCVMPMRDSSRRSPAHRPSADERAAAYGEMGRLFVCHRVPRCGRDLLSQCSGAPAK